MPAILDVRDSLGALLIGCFVAVALSGLVTFQVGIYFRLYKTDSRWNRVIVVAVWILDIIHTCLICASLWKYLIANFGNVTARREGVVPQTVALSVAATAFITIITHLFYLRRLVHLSKYNWFIIGPTLLMAVGRVVCGLITTTELIRYRTFPAFTARYKSVWALGLSFSSVVDIVITFGMCFYLQESRRGFGTMDELIDEIIIYTINNGTITCVATVVSTICWLVMPHNLIFMALHFPIAKMYANSLLATLNMRREFRGRAAPPKENGNPLPVLFPDSYNRNNIADQRIRGGSIEFTDVTDTKGLHITVEKTVQYDVEDDRASGPSSNPNSPSPLPVKHEEV
ncbi:hypothetical protein BC826DRAFT_997106 [Russula brevipes]|nr:hypothetical protein BC826DRAFT_997106 [Russula brevipes]